MILRASTAFAIAVFLPNSAPLAAQELPELDGEQQVGTRFLQEPEPVEAARARKMQKKVARCVYSSNEREVEDLLAKSDFHRIDFDAVGTESEDLFDELDVSRCIGRAMRNDEYRMQMRFQYSTMRNLLAEEAYQEANRDPLTLAADAPLSLTNRYSMGRVYPPTMVIAELGDCITKNDPAGAHEFLDKQPSSSGESEAFENLFPVIGTCMNTDQEEVTLQISLMRQIVADALWSRYHYGPQPAAAASAQGADE